MARQKSADPKLAITLRVPKSVVEAYKARGEKWRDLMTERLSDKPVDLRVTGEPVPPKSPKPRYVNGPPKHVRGYAIDGSPIY